MSITIAIAGKGGVGKTTVAGLLVSRLLARDCTPVLAIDADPNTCLDEVLGVSATISIGRVREEAREVAAQGMSAGISKQQLLEMKISESLVEADNFDLLAMGRPEGPGCYCYANNVLKEAINQIADSYPYMVIDNEAGLENLSRRIVTGVDLLVMVADPSKRGIDTVRRIHRLAEEMGVKHRYLAVIVNRLRSDRLPVAAARLKEETGADIVCGMPDNAELASLAEEGGSILDLKEVNPTTGVMDAVLDIVCNQRSRPEQLPA